MAGDFPPQRGVLRLDDDGHRALFALHELDPSSTAYHLSAVFEIDVEVEAACLAAAASELHRRHEALRAVFDAPDGVPSYRLGDAPPDQRLWPSPAESGAGLRAALERLVDRPFDLRQGPPWRLRAWPSVRTPGHTGLALVVHHLVADLPSMIRLVDELVDLVRGVAVEATAPSWSRWLEERCRRLESEAATGATAYWRGHLDPQPPALDLPTDRPRRAARQRARRRQRWLEPGLRAAIDELAARSGASHFAVLLSAVAVLLARWSGQGRFALGSLAEVRRPPGLVGYGVNTLALRFDLAPSGGFTTVLAATRREVHAALRHRELPFARLVRELAPERGAGESPFFRVLFGFQRPRQKDRRRTTESGEAGALILGLEGEPFPRHGARLAPLEAPATAPMFDLSWTVAPARDGLLCRLDGDRGLFDATTLERLLRHLETTLRGALTAPATPLAELPLASAAESHQLRVESNDTARAWPDPPRPAGGVMAEIAAAVERWPGATALVGDHGELDYRALGQRVEALRRRLVELGAGPERVVAVHLERSLDLPVALLAVLAA
ncbi:MAG: AMP-binding protein, partial [Acidobacteria bacterium]|nr:AMP-binding protein [Acidobacteriota bacterium]